MTTGNKQPTSVFTPTISIGAKRLQYRLALVFAAFINLAISPLFISKIMAQSNFLEQKSNQKNQIFDVELKKLLKKTIANAKSFDDRFDAEVWLLQKSTVLKKFIKDPDTRLSLLKEIHGAAREADLPPEFVLSLIEVESHFDRYAISSAGAQGLMQVMPFWKNEIGREHDNLTDVRTNLRYGCTILKYYLDMAKQSWPEALARYNGSYGKLWYPNRVMIAWDKHWR